MGFEDTVRKWAPDWSAGYKTGSVTYENQAYNVMNTANKHVGKPEEASVAIDELVTQVNYLLVTDHPELSGTTRSQEADGFVRVDGFLADMQKILSDKPDLRQKVTDTKALFLNLNQGKFDQLGALFQPGQSAVPLSEAQKKSLLDSIEVAASKKPNFASQHATIKLVKDNFDDIQKLAGATDDTARKAAVTDLIKAKGMAGLQLLENLKNDPNIVLAFSAGNTSLKTTLSNIPNIPAEFRQTVVDIAQKDLDPAEAIKATSMDLVKTKGVAGLETLEKLKNDAKIIATISAIDPAAGTALKAIPNIPAEFKQTVADIIQKGTEPMEAIKASLANSKNPGKTLTEALKLASNPVIKAQLKPEVQATLDGLGNIDKESDVIAAALTGKDMDKAIKSYLSNGGDMQKLSALATKPEVASLIPNDKKALLENFSKIDPKLFPIIEASAKGDKKAFAAEATKIAKARLEELATKGNGGVLTIGIVEDMVKSAPQAAQDAFYTRINQQVEKIARETKLAAAAGSFDLRDPSTYVYKLTADTLATEDLKMKDDLNKKDSGRVMIAKDEPIGTWGVAIAQTEKSKINVHGVEVELNYGTLDISKLARAEPITKKQLDEEIIPELQKSLEDGNISLSGVSKEQLIALGIPKTQAIALTSALGTDKIQVPEADKAALELQLAPINASIAKAKAEHPNLATDLDNISKTLTDLTKKESLTEEQATTQVKNLQGALANILQSDEFAKEAERKKKEANNGPLFDMMAKILDFAAGILNLFAHFVPSLKPLADRITKGASAFHNGDMEKLALIDGDAKLTENDLQLAVKKKILTEFEAESLSWAIKAEPLAPMIANMIPVANTVLGVGGGKGQ